MISGSNWESGHSNRREQKTLGSLSEWTVRSRVRGMSGVDRTVRGRDEGGRTRVISDTECSNKDELTD